MSGNRNVWDEAGAPFNHLVSSARERQSNSFSDPTSIDDLRRRQEAFHRVREKLDLQNSWMAIPVFAPVAVPFIPAGVVESVAARLAGEKLAGVTKLGPLRLTRGGISNIKGENIYARAGRLEHQRFGERVDAKPGWESERAIPGSRLRPDAGAPPRNPAKPDQRNYLELKPDTPSGRRAASKAVQKYEDASGGKARGVFYDQTEALKRLP